jgi:hypothetical protein
VQVWNYPDLGMSVELWDRFLTHTYDIPHSSFEDLDPRPDPEFLAERTDVIALAGGRGVFNATTPGARPLAMRAACARFPSGANLRVLGSLGADAEPGDSLWGAWALADSTGHVIARASRRLDVSTCAPAEEQRGSFAMELPPGDYRVDFSAWDRHGRRGVEHRRVSVGRPGPGPLLSDLVLLCEASPLVAEPDAVQIEPAFGSRIEGRQLTLYCEIDGLLSSPVRPASFVYRSRIFALDAKGRPKARPAYEASREVENVGSHRRQFVVAPIEDLPRGSYEFVLEVTDRANESTARGTVRFVKEGRR